jgi:hypothetical protein
MAVGGGRGGDWFEILFLGCICVEFEYIVFNTSQKHVLWQHLELFFPKILACLNHKYISTPYAPYTQLWRGRGI